jgi:triosephosphate isomerase
MARVAKPARRPLVAGNWKMHLNHLEAIGLVQKIAFSLKDSELDAVEVVVLPPFTAVRSVQTLVDGDKLPIGYGAQDVSQHDSGAYTGEISGPMLSRLSCSYVVVGHSERRQYHCEDDALVAAKAGAAFRHGITPIICIGEPLEVRERDGHLDHCISQLEGSVAGLTDEQIAGSVIAYEPIWAIGTGRTASAADAQEMCASVRACLTARGEALGTGVRILYGGSVKSGNAEELLGQPDVDGALVGGASLDADEFVAIARASVSQ